MLEVNDMKTKNVVSWFEIYVTDIDRAKEFYRTILGKELNKMPIPEELGMEMWAFPWIDDAQNAAGALVKSDMGQPSSSGTIVYFDSEDCSELNKVEEAGGRILLPKTPVEGFGFFCLISDTEGNTVGFFSTK
jgi:predicted enzyme related to lactoylglutathione lyase